MRKNSNGLVKKLTITATVAVFALGVGCAVKAAGDANSDNKVAVKVVAAGNEDVAEHGTALDVKETEAATDVTMETQTTVVTVETESQTETETQTQTPAVQTQAPTEAKTEVQTQAPTEAQTEAPVQETEAATEAVEIQAAAPVVTIDSRITEVIAGINAERAAAGVPAVTYDATLSAMASTRATENADNNFFKVVNGKHMRPDGRTASSICQDFSQYGYFGEVMGRYQQTPEEIVLGWHNSPAHYNCMTSAKYNRVGAAVAADSNGHLYWVAIFMD